VLVAHGIPSYFEGEDFAVANDVRERDALCAFDGLDRLAGSDATEQGETVGAFFTAANGEYVNRAAAVVRALEQAFVLEIGDVFVHGGERAQSQTAGDFLVGGRVAVLLGEAGEEVDNLFLPPCYSHAEIVANKKRIARSFSKIYLREVFERATGVGS